MIFQTLLDTFSGKTALHWAAAVNNLEAAIALLHHGAERDVQDDRNQTPLFIAAREGSYEVAQLLLENLANSNLPDHMNMLPRDVAAERRHDSVVDLLDNFSAKPLSTVANTQSSGVVLPSYVRQMVKRKKEQLENKETHPAKLSSTSSQSGQQSSSSSSSSVISSFDAVSKSRKKGHCVTAKHGSVPGNCNGNQETSGANTVQERNGVIHRTGKSCGDTLKCNALESHAVTLCRPNVPSVSSGHRSREFSAPQNQWTHRVVDQCDVNQNYALRLASPHTAANAPAWQYDDLSPPDSNCPSSPNSLSNGLRGASPRLKFTSNILGERKPGDSQKTLINGQSVSSNRLPQFSMKNVEVFSCLNSNLIGLDAHGQCIETSSLPFAFRHYPITAAMQNFDLPIVLQSPSLHALNPSMTPSPDVLAEVWPGSSPSSVQSEWLDASTSQPTTCHSATTNHTRAETEQVCTKWREEIEQVFRPRFLSGRICRIGVILLLRKPHIDAGQTASKKDA